MPRQSWQSPGLTRGTSYTDQRVISRIIITFTADQGESPIRSLEDISTTSISVSGIPSFTFLYWYSFVLFSVESRVWRINNSDVYNISRRTNEKKRSFHPHYTVCALMKFSLSPVGRSFSLLLTLLLLLLTPYPWFIISSTPYILGYFLPFSPWLFPSWFDLIDIDDYAYATHRKRKRNTFTQSSQDHEERLKVR